MSVRALTDDAVGLLARIKKLLDQGHIDSWAYDDTGDFTHTASSGQWKNKAWFRPEAKSDRLRFRLIKPKNNKINRTVFAVYHGRFIEMLIGHVPDYFTDARATPNPDADEPSLEG
jgi:hypothetical protein